MPRDLLKRLCSALLPEKIEEQAEIDKLMVLQTQGLIEVDIPEFRIERGRRCYAGCAIVMRVTPRGQTAATRLPAGEPATRNAPHRASVASPFL